jgi:hypothetical protein
VDLRLDDIERPGELLGAGDGFFNGQGRIARRNGDAELGQQFLGLILMDVHRCFSLLQA